MRIVAIFGIDSGPLSTVIALLLLFVVAVYFALVFWTYQDAKRRIADPLLVACATVASMFPFVGTIVYLILRPPEFLEDARERELEIAAAEARLVQLHDSACPHCAFPVEKSFLRCPSCLKRLKEPCVNCRKPLDPRWKICPYCEAEVGQAALSAGAAALRQRPLRLPGRSARRRRPSRLPLGHRARQATA